MVLRCKNILDNGFAIGQAVIALAETHHADLCAARVISIRKIEEMVGRKLWMHGEAHQTTFTLRLDVGNAEQRLRPQLAVFKNADSPGTFGKEHASARRPND